MRPDLIVVLLANLYQDLSLDECYEHIPVKKLIPHLTGKKARGTIILGKRGYNATTTQHCSPL
jgi:hypothetical protein